MKSSEKMLIILFWLLLIADCILIKERLQEYRVFTKILLIPVLLISIYIASKETKHRRSKALANLAFFFCFLGDLSLLDSEDTSYFMLGLTSFLLAHIFFIIFFFRLKAFKDKYRLYLFTMALIIFSYFGALLFLIWSGVSRQGYNIPIIIYAVILGVMLLTAVHSINNKSIKRLAQNFFIPGAILFVLSDSILALTKFAISFPYSDILIMITYAGAIFLLSMGVIRFLKK